MPLSHWHERWGSYFKRVIFEHISWVNLWSTSCEFVYSWMQQNTLDDKSTYVWLLVLCRQAAIYCLSQCWPRSIKCGTRGPSGWIMTGFFASSLGKKFLRHLKSALFAQRRNSHTAICQQNKILHYFTLIQIPQNLHKCSYLSDIFHGIFHFSL